VDKSTGKGTGEGGDGIMGAKRAVEIGDKASEGETEECEESRVRGRKN
jgi:hypothetical protein